MKKISVQNQNNKIRDFVLHPFEVLFIVVFVIYLFAPVRAGDDVWFISTYLTGFKGNLVEFLKFRYETWSTRLLLEAVTLLLLYFPFLYKLSIAAWLTAIAAGVDRLISVGNGSENISLQNGKPDLPGISKTGNLFGIQRRNIQWMLCLAIILLPIGMNARAGFVCTTVNYIFTLACFIWAVMPGIERLRGQKPAIWRYLLSLPLLVLACNMEYYCPSVLVVLLVLLGMTIYQRKNPIWLIFMTAITLVSIYFAFNAPANTLDGYSNDNSMFPGYELLGTAEKLQAGFVSTAGGLISSYTYGDNFLIGTLTLSVLLVLRGLEKEHGLMRAVHFIPAAITLATGCAARFCPEESAWRRLFFDEDSGWLWNSSVTLILSFVFFLAVLLCFRRINRYLCLWTALALLCRISMGASRSVFVSGLRTFFPLLLVFAVGCVLMCIDVKRSRKPALSVLACGAGVSVMLDIVALVEL